MKNSLIGALAVVVCAMFIACGNSKDGLLRGTVYVVGKTDLGVVTLKKFGSNYQSPFMAPQWCLYGDGTASNSKYNYSDGAEWATRSVDYDSKCVWLKPAVKEVCPACPAHDDRPNPAGGFGMVR